MASILNRAIGFFMIPIYTTYLRPADYGVMELLYMTTSLIGMVVGVGISNGMNRFYFDSEDQEYRNRVVSSAYYGLGAIVIPIVGLLIAGSSFFASHILDSSKYTNYFVIAFLAMGVDLFNQIGLSYFRVNKKSTTVMIISLSGLVVTLVFNIYFVVVLEWGVWGIFLGNLIGALAVFVTITPLILKRVGISISRKITIELLKFGLPLIPSNVASYIVVASDRYFIKEYVSMSQAGIYSLGYKFGSLVNSFITSPFTQIWFPRRFELFGKENSEQIFCRIFTYFTCAIVFVGLGISILSKEIVEIMAEKSYWEAYRIIPLITLAHIFLSFFYHFNIGIYIEKKTKLFALINVTNGILNMVLNIVLISKFGIWGAAVSTTICYIYRAGLTYYFSNRLHKIHVEWQRVITLFALAIAYYFIFGEIDVGNRFLNIIIKSAICLTYPGVLLITKFFTTEEIKQLKYYLKKGRDALRRNNTNI